MSLELDLVTCNAVISACEKSAEWQRVFLLMEEMADLQLKAGGMTLAGYGVRALNSRCARKSVEATGTTRARVSYIMRCLRTG